MQFIKQMVEQAEQALARQLAGELRAGKRVVWLISGGSNVPVEVAIMHRLRTEIPDLLENLTVLPADERYGPHGHKDSNTEALRAAVFDQGKATWLDVLSRDLPFSETVSYYNDLAAGTLAMADVVIAQLGLGTDGHTAGILPDSPACSEDYATVMGYSWHDYERLTLSPRALIDNVTAAYVFAYGESKREALTRLQTHDEPLARLPATLLYDIPNVYVYNDYVSSEEQT